MFLQFTISYLEFCNFVRYYFVLKITFILYLRILVIQYFSNLNFSFSVFLIEYFDI